MNTKSSSLLLFFLYLSYSFSRSFSLSCFLIFIQSWRKVIIITSSGERKETSSFSSTLTFRNWKLLLIFFFSSFSFLSIFLQFFSCDFSQHFSSSKLPPLGERVSVSENKRSQKIALEEISIKRSRKQLIETLDHQLSIITTYTKL